MASRVGGSGGGRRAWPVLVAGIVLAAGLAVLRPGSPPEAACGAFAAQTPVPPEPVSADAPGERRIEIVIDLAAHTLTLYVDGAAVRQYPVGLGKPSTPTPVGEWRVVHKDRGWGGGFGTRWLGLDVPWGIYGIHGTNKPYSVGGNDSGGCIRMHNRDVEDLWPRVPRGTPVRIVGPLDRPDVRGRLRPGIPGEAVVALQLALRAAGHDPGRADGRYGPATAAAVRSLQAWYGLDRHGEAGPDEQALLGW